jgi:hypothetical protein
MARLLPAVLVLAATSALAHIHLDSPPGFQVTDALGNPQKTAPCGGPGTPSNIVTTVEAGSTLTVSWTDTIFHPGHYRISIAPDPADFVTPTPVINANNCESAPIESTPVLPTVADGVYPHTTGTSGMMRSYDITVPMMRCDTCTLQLMQFMASHAPPCFYYQCATLRIVMPDAGVAMDAGTDAGVEMDAGTSTDAGAGNDAGTSTDAGTGVDAGTTTDGGTDAGTNAGGCGCTTPVAAVSWLAAAVLLLARRRASR